MAGVAQMEAERFSGTSESIIPRSLLFFFRQRKWESANNIHFLQRVCTILK